MEKYTFQDWLDGEHRLIFRKPLYVLYHYNLISEEDYEKITKCQEEAHDIIVECLFETLIQGFLEHYGNTIYKTDFLENEIKLLQKIMNKQARKMNYVLSGDKDFKEITGQQYHEIMDDGPVCLSSNESMKLIAGYRYLKWLECFKDNAKPEEKINESIRRPVAFAVCLLYLNGKYDIAQMTKENLKKFISLNFKNVSAQRVLFTLLGYEPRFENEKPVFYYNGNWQFKDDNFEYMKSTYPEDFKKGTELFNTLK